MREAATTLQAHFRRKQVQKQLSKLHSAAILIQATFRGYYQWKRYTVMKNSVHVIEERWLTTLRCREAMRRYSTLRNAVIVIQSHVRRRNVQKSISHQHKMATVIQASVRGHVLRKRFIEVKQSVSVLQCYWRATLQARQHRAEYVEYKRAVTVLQSHVRRERVQRMVSSWNKAASIIQAMYRMYIQRKEYLKVKQSVGVIEERWNATLQARRVREAYHKERRAVITVQSLIRRWLVKRTLDHWNRSAIVIQSYYRCYSQRKKYMNMKAATVAVQRHWQAVLVGRRCRRVYEQQRKAAILIQACVRRLIVWRMISEQRNAAIIIQARFKGYIQRKKYISLKRSASVIRCHWKATLHARQYRTAYLERRQAVITLQSHYKRWKVQKEQSVRLKAAIVIQASIRQYIQRQKYTALKCSVQVIERYWSATLLARQCRAKYTQYRDAVITIQAHVRRWKVERTMEHHRSCATKIQSVFRCYSQRNRYLAMKQSVLVIQCYWRATVQARQHRAEYVEYKRAVTVLQSYVRRERVQRMVSSWNIAASIIQAMYRMYIQRKAYLKVKQSVGVIEERWKATLQAKDCRVSYLHLQKAAILLQSLVRMRSVQKSLAHQHRAATVIQSTYRSHYQHKHFTALKHSTRILQYYWRGTLMARQCRAEYIATREAAIVCQSYFRLKQVKRMIDHWNWAAIKIQSSYRCHLQRQRYLNMKRAVGIVSKYRQALSIGRFHRETFVRLRHAAVTIQANYRRWKVQAMMADQHRMATVIQSVYRGYTKRKDYVSLKRSTSVLQCYWRATLLARQCRDEYHQMRQAAVTIQAHHRRRLVQKEMASLNHSALVIQTSVRGFMSRVRYHRMKMGVATIQRYWRARLEGKRQRREFIHLRQCVVLVQSHTRRWLVQKRLVHLNTAAIKIQSMVQMHVQRNQYTNLKRSTTVIQSYWKATLIARQCRKDYLDQKKAAIFCQACFRRQHTLRMINHWNTSATIIQARYRCHSQHKKYSSLRQSTCVIQNYWRATLLARQCRDEYHQMRQAAVTIQAHYRRRLVQKEMASLNHSALVIQTIVRGFMCRVRYHRMKMGVVTIQRYWRARLEGKRQRREFVHLRQCVVLVQSHTRRWLVQKHLSIMHTSATKIQAMVRGQQHRQRYTLIKDNVLTVQRKWRAILLARKQRQAYLRVLGGVVTMQSFVRGWLVIKKYHQLKMAAIVVQSQYRSVVARRQYLELRGVVITIQRARRAKTILRRLKRLKELEELSGAAVSIQRCWRRYREICLYERKINNCAIEIQSFWRGYKVRRKIRSKAVIAARKKIEAVNKSAKDSNKLMNRLPSMLDAFLNAKFLSTAGNILKSFDLMTSVSERCSVVIVDGNALPILYNFIENSNRSLATLGTIKIGLRILNNLLKWKATKLSVVSTNQSLICLVDLMHKIYATNPDTTLLAAVLVHSYCKQNGQKVLPSNCHRKVVSMHSVLTRKVKASSSSTGSAHLQCRTAAINSLLQYLNEIIIIHGSY